MEKEVDDASFIMLDGDVGEVWRTNKKSEPKAPPSRMKVGKERRAVRTEEEDEAPELKMIGANDQPHWMTVSQFRRYWNERWSGYYGSFEDTTRISPMRFTDEPVEEAYANDMDTLQIFSVKLAAARGGLQLPLDVFGMVAIGDPADHNRNIIFHRERDDCQTLTQKEPYLVLTGPTRAVILELNPVIVEVDLKVKGTTESKDVYLSFLVAPLRCYETMFSRLFKRTYSSKLSTLEFAFGQIGFSLEATIFVQIVHGSWPDGLHGQFAAFTTGFTDRCPMPVGDNESTGTGAERIILLDSGGEKMPVADDGKIELSRRVVSVEGCGQVIVQVKAFKGETEIVEITKRFQAANFSKSTVEIDISFCKMEITVFKVAYLI